MSIEVNVEIILVNVVMALLVIISGVFAVRGAIYCIRFPFKNSPLRWTKYAFYEYSGAVVVLAFSYAFYLSGNKQSWMITVAAIAGGVLHHVLFGHKAKAFVLAEEKLEDSG